MRFKNSLLALFAAVPFALACSSDCYDLCDDALDEACVRFDHGNCVHACTDAEDFFEEEDKCEEKYDELIDCAADVEDICDYQSGPDPKDTTPPKPECDDEAEEYQECFNEYCEDHPNKDWCTAWAPVPAPAG